MSSLVQAAPNKKQINRSGTLYHGASLDREAHRVDAMFE
jgi:hypothetical protein